MFDRGGVTALEQTVPWSGVLALIAVTDVHTTSTNGLKSSERTHRLVIVCAETGADGQHRMVRPEYGTKFTPALEQLLPALARIAPHVEIADRRTAV